MDQFNRLTVTSNIASCMVSLLGVPTVLYLVEPFLNILATLIGAPIGMIWSFLLRPLRAIGYPVYGIAKLAAMPIDACFGPVIKGLGATAISIEQASVAIQDLFLLNVLPAVSLQGVIEQLLYGESLSALLYLISLPTRAIRALVSIPLWPLKLVATIVQIVSIGIMVPIRLVLIPTLICLNMIVLPFDMMGYLGSGTVLYLLYMCIPPEIIALFKDVSTLPSRMSSLVDTVLWRLLVTPCHYILELLRSLPFIGQMLQPKPIASEGELAKAGLGIPDIEEITQTLKGTTA